MSENLVQMHYCQYKGYLKVKMIRLWAKLDHMSWINVYAVNVRTWMNLDYTANQLNGI